MFVPIDFLDFKHYLEKMLWKSLRTFTVLCLLFMGIEKSQTKKVKVGKNIFCSVKKSFSHLLFLAQICNCGHQQQQQKLRLPLKSKNTLWLCKLLLYSISLLPFRWSHQFYKSVAVLRCNFFIKKSPLSAQNLLISPRYHIM